MENISKGGENKNKIVIVDVSSSIEEEARDKADARMTASKKEMRGIGGFLKKMWKFGIAEEYYRNKEIVRARKKILDESNIYAGESEDKAGHEEAMMATVERFALEYEEVLHEDAGEIRQLLGKKEILGKDDRDIKNKLQGLIKDYVGGNLNEDAFKEEKARIFLEINGAKKEVLDKGTMYADNLLEIARNVKQAVEHGKKLEEFDLDFDVVIGRAKSGVRTEAQFNAVDRITEKLATSKVGCFVNEATIATAVSLAYSAGAFFSKRLANSKLAAWGSFGATAGLAAAFAGLRESRKLEDERRQHAREMAKGKIFDADKAPRRKEMEEFRYETREANDLSDALEAGLFSDKDGKKEVREIKEKKDFLKIMTNLAEIESRIQLSDSQKIDLISFSEGKKVEGERLRLDIARAQAKVELRKIARANNEFLPEGKTMDQLLSSMKEMRMNSLVEGDQGMEKKELLFKKMKKKKIASAAVKGLAVGMAFGAVAQEIGAFFREDQEGLFEVASTHAATGKSANSPQHYTVLEYLRRLATGEVHQSNPPIDGPGLGKMHEVFVGGHHIHIQQGAGIISNPDGSFDLIRNGALFVKGIAFDPTGALSQESLKLLEARGVDAGSFGMPSDQIAMAEVGQNLETHKIHRELWYDNDTLGPNFDKNELKLNWGGKYGSGIDADGNYVFNVGHMTDDGSHHGKFSVNAEEAAKTGKLKMIFSLSRETQNQVVEVPIDANGNAVIDPKSEIGKILFATKAGGQAEFLGKYAEVAEVVGSQDGIDQVRILATHVGHGTEMPIAPQEMIQPLKSNPITIFNVPSPEIGIPANPIMDGVRVDVLPFLFYPGRKPLETMSEKEKQIVKRGQAILSSMETSALANEKEAETKEQREKWLALLLAIKTIKDSQRGKSAQSQTSGEDEKKFALSRIASMHTFYKIKQFEDLNAENIIEGEKKFLALTRELWNELAVHEQPDLDAKSCLKMMELAGIDTSGFKMVEKGRQAEEGITMDTAMKDGVIAEEDGRRLIFDHHGEESGRSTSATKFVYETLVEMGLLQKEPHLDKFAEFVTKCDNMNFSPEEMEKVYRNYPKNLYGLSYRMKVEDILELIKDGADPMADLSDDYLKTHQYIDTRNGRQIPLVELAKHLESQIKKGKKSLENLEKAGFAVDTGKDRFGKILIDTKKNIAKERYYNRVDGDNNSNQLEVFRKGYDGYLIWSPIENSFILFTKRKMDEESLPGGFSQGFNMRGNMWMKPRDEVKLEISLEEVLSRLSGNPDFKIENKLKKILDIDAAGKNTLKLIDEGGLTEDEMKRIIKEKGISIKELMKNISFQRPKDKLWEKFDKKLKSLPAAEQKRYQKMIDIALELFTKKNNASQKQVSTPAVPSQQPANQPQQQPVTPSASPKQQPQAPSQQPPAPNQPQQAPKQPKQASAMPQQPAASQQPPNMPQQPDAAAEKQKNLSESANRLVAPFSSFDLSYDMVKEEARKIQAEPGELAIEFVRQNPELKTQFEVKTGSMSEKEKGKLAIIMILEDEKKKVEEKISNEGETDDLRINLRDIKANILEVKVTMR